MEKRCKIEKIFEQIIHFEAKINEKSTISKKILMFLSKILHFCFKFLKLLPFFFQNHKILQKNKDFWWKTWKIWPFSFIRAGFHSSKSSFIHRGQVSFIQVKFHSFKSSFIHSSQVSFIEAKASINSSRPQSRPQSINRLFHQGLNQLID